MAGDRRSAREFPEKGVSAAGGQSCAFAKAAFHLTRRHDDDGGLQRACQRRAGDAAERVDNLAGRAGRWSRSQILRFWRFLVDRPRGFAKSVRPRGCIRG